MRTLADLKRDLTIGRSLTLVYFETQFTVNNKNLNKVRYIVKIQSTGVYLNEDKNACKGSFLEYPKSSLLEYDGGTITIYEPGTRDLTKEEQSIIDNEPRDREQEERDIMTDGSTMFYRKKQYYNERGYEYLFMGNSKRNKGKYLTRDRNTDRLMIQDDAIKGKIILKYTVGV